MSTIFQSYTTTKFSLPVRCDTAQWAFSLNISFASKYLQQDLLKLSTWWDQMENKTKFQKRKVIIFSRSILASKTEPNLKLYGETLKVYPQVKFPGITFDSQLTFKKQSEDILAHCNTRYHPIRILTKKVGT